MNLIRWSRIIVMMVAAYCTPAISQEGGDDPSARAGWEWMRLHDPATGRIPPDIRRQELEFAKALPTVESRMNNREKGRSFETQTVPTWNLRGPYNVGGRTRALAKDISNSNVILAGGVSGGMWRSTDDGKSWNKTTTPSQLHSVTCICQDTRRGKNHIWYYGTGESQIIDGVLLNSASSDKVNGKVVAAFVGDGVFKSIDSGKTWYQLPSTMAQSAGNPFFSNSFNYVWNIATDPSAPLNRDVVYAATVGCIQKSSDGGNSWEPILGQLYDPRSAASNCGAKSSNAVSLCTDLATSNSGVVYATLGKGSTAGDEIPAPCSGIFRLDPFSHSWTDITPSCQSWWPQKYNLLAIAISSSSPEVVYFLADTPNGPSAHRFQIDPNDPNSKSFWQSLWKYTDGTTYGVHIPCRPRGFWVDLTAKLPADFGAYGSYNLVIKAKPNDPKVIFLGGINLYRTADGFATDLGHLGCPHSDQHAIVFDPADPFNVLLGNDGGIYQRNFGPSGDGWWHSLNNGYTNSQFYTVATDHATSGSNLVLGGLQDNSTWWSSSALSTDPWNLIGGGDGAYCAIADGGNTFYVSSQNGEIYKKNIGGQPQPVSGCNEWSPYVTAYAEINRGGGTTYDYMFIDPFALDPTNQNTMYLAAGNTLRRNKILNQIHMYGPCEAVPHSLPEPIGWENLCTAFSTDAQISAIGVSRSLPAPKLYFGTTDGHIYRVDNPGSSSSPTTAIEITGSHFPQGAYVSCIAVHPLNSRIAIVVFSNYFLLGSPLWLTTDAGVNWTPIGGNLASIFSYGPSCRWATFTDGVGGYNNVFIGTSTGVYSSGFRYYTPTADLNASTIWAQEGSASIGNVVVDMLDARWEDGYIAAGTHGNGVFTSTVPHPLRIHKFAPSWLQKTVNDLYVFHDKATHLPLTVTNLDSISFSIHLGSTDTFFTVVPESVTIGAGDRATLSVNFGPGFPGVHRTIIGLDMGPFGTDSIPLGVVMVSKPFTLSRKSLDFAFLVEGRSRQDSLVITSTDPDSMLVHVRTLGSQFLAVPPDFNCAPFSQRIVYVRYTAGTPGPSTGGLFIQADSTTGFYQADSVSLAATSVNSPFLLEGSRVIFPAMLQGSSIAKPISITNASSDSSISIDSIFSSNSEFSMSPLSALIPPLSSVSFAVTFHPFAVGERNGYLIFSHTGGSNPTDSVRVSGFGLDSTEFRTFRAESLALARDLSGKYKSVKPKPDKESFCFTITKQDHGFSDGLHLEFSSVAIPGTLISIPLFSASTISSNGKSLDLSFNTEFHSVGIDSGTQVRICGWAQKGKLVKLSKYWWTNQGVQVGAVLKNKSAFTSQVGLLPMPNLHNLGEAVFGGGGFSLTNGELIGLGGAHSVLLKKYGDVMHSLNKKGLTHTMGPKCLSQFDDGKPINKQQHTLPASKQNNELFARQVALKVAVKASQMGFTPVGLGELRYDDSSANPLNGRTVDEIIQITDSMLTLCSVSDPRITLLGVDSTIGIINAAFDGPMDTIQFANGLILKGVQPLAAVPYLQPSGFTPIRMQPRLGYQHETPREFTLYQNYPNPFNPTTTIEFDLLQTSIVTLKVYNVLGQEVVTLIDHEQMDDGSQEVEFIAGRLASGVYFYQVTVEGLNDDGMPIGDTFSQVKKLLLIK